MRKYRVNVNGTMYEIEIEEINGSSSMAAPDVDGGPSDRPCPYRCSC